MTDEQLQAAAQIFSDLEDDRVNRGLNHNLVTIVSLVFCAAHHGAESFREIQTFGQVKRDWLGRFLDMRRVPDHETIRRVMTRLNPAAFQHCAFTWIQQAVGGALGEDDHIAIDGKRLRGSRRGELQGIHLLNVWSVWTEPLRADQEARHFPPPSARRLTAPKEPVCPDAPIAASSSCRPSIR